MKNHPKAIYVHCVSHSLNLALSNSSEIPPIRSCMGTVQKIWVIFNTPKRQAVLKQKVLEKLPDSKKNKLKQMCPTRWVQRYDAVMVIVELMPAVCATLEEIQQWEDKNSSSGAFVLLHAIQQSEFIVSLMSSAKLLSYILKSSKSLQSYDSDLSTAISYAETTVSAISNTRQHAKEEFSAVFKECNEMANMLGTEISQPRITSRQADTKNQHLSR